MAEKKSKVYGQRKVITATIIDKPMLESPWGVAFNCSSRQLVVSDTQLQLLAFFGKKRIYVGTKGVEPGQFSVPTGVAFQPIVDNLLVCDSRNHRVQMMNQDHKVVAIIGTTDRAGKKDGQFNDPHGVACSPDGNFSVADTHNDRVQQFDSSGRFLREFDRNGRGNHFLLQPSEVSFLDRRFAPSSVASSLMMLATDVNRLAVWSSDGSQVIKNVWANSCILGICVDLNGFVHVSSSAHCIDVLDPRMDFGCLQTIGGSCGSGPGQFYFPRGLCVDHSNTLIVADVINKRLQFFD